MRRKFKVGDRVERREDCDDGTWKKGEQATIDIVDCDGDIKLTAERGIIYAKHWKKVKNYKPPVLKDRYVLINDSKKGTYTNIVFHTKIEAERFIKSRGSPDPILCKLVPVCRMGMKTVYEEESYTE